MISLKRKLRQRKLTIGSWLSIGNTAVGEVMAGAGFEWIVVDMEHSAITLSQAQELIRVIALSGLVPLVRVGENNPNLIKRVMDAGASGVIVPMVNSCEDAQAGVEAVKYPPQGRRGVGLARAQGYGFGFAEYKKWVAKESIVIAQIEHIQAIENLEEILDTQGLDGTIIGPYDLSGSLGYPGELNSAPLRKAIIRYENICRKKKKPMGIHVVKPNLKTALGYKNKGYTFLAVGLDTLYLGENCRQMLKGLR